jgi:myo-inositol-1(or 4)-monophosphatase
MSEPRTAGVTDGLASLTVELAVGAGELIRRSRHHAFGVSAKTTPTDVVTEVDREVESWLVDEIRRRRPTDAVLGEEGGDRRGNSAVRWLIDPIDGTVNFVLDLPAYSVSIAAEVDGVVVAGAVLNPATGDLFHAERGVGAYLGETRLFGPRDVPISRAVVGTGFAYDSVVRGRQGEVAARLLTEVGDIRRLGSAALDLCFVAAGRLDAFYEAALNSWDRAAGLLVAEEAGCVTSGLRGRRPGRAMTAAAHAGHGSHFFALLEELGADRVL